MYYLLTELKIEKMSEKTARIKKKQKNYQI